MFLVPSEALGDGKFFARPDAPQAGEPFQRAILVWRDGREILLVQPQYAGEAGEFGWIVPVPGVPDLGVIENGDLARLAFTELAMATTVVNRHLSQYFALAAAIVFATFFLLALMCVCRVFRTSPGVEVALKLGLTLPILLLPAIAVPSLLRARGLADVEVLGRNRFGVFDTTVIRGDDPKAVQSWLADHGFRVGPEDEAAFASYVARGWCFVASRIAADAGAVEASEGFLHPLVLAFDAPEPVYPYALSATAGEPTEIALYVLADTGVENPLLPLKYRGPAGDAAQELFRAAEWQDPAAAARADAMLGGPLVLTKLRGPLSDKEATEDLVMKVKPELPAFREVVWKW